jgi:hypothetical protein
METSERLNGNNLLPDLFHSPDPVKSGSLTDFRPTSRSVPETQNFDPVGFKRVHDNNGTFDKRADVGSFANTMSRFGKFAQYLNPVAKPSYVSLRRGRAIFSDKFADLDKVRFCLSG